LPPAYSPHNSYFLWGRDADLSPRLVIAVGVGEEQLRAAFGDVEQVAVLRCVYCMGWRDNVPIRVARSPKRPLREVWPELRRYGLPARKLALLEAGSPE
jgi:hypothetical protein